MALLLRLLLLCLWPLGPLSASEIHPFANQLEIHTFPEKVQPVDLHFPSLPRGHKLQGSVIGLLPEQSTGPDIQVRKTLGFPVNTFPRRVILQATLLRYPQVIKVQIQAGNFAVVVTATEIVGRQTYWFSSVKLIFCTSMSTQLHLIFF